MIVDYETEKLHMHILIKRQHLGMQYLFLRYVRRRNCYCSYIDLHKNKNPPNMHEKIQFMAYKCVSMMQTISIAWSLIFNFFFIRDTGIQIVGNSMLSVFTVLLLCSGKNEWIHVLHAV